MNQKSSLFFALSVVFCVGFLTVGCTHDEGSPIGTGGKGGKGGSGGKGGAGGYGGSTAKGGSGGSSTGGGGGSGSGGTGAGGSSSTGGGTGAGGATLVGGASGFGGQGGGGVSGAGGTGTGGSTNLDGGSTSPMDGGGIDMGGSDAEDAPLPGDDVPAAEESGADVIAPVFLDSGTADAEQADLEPTDTTAVLLDGEIDTTMLDVSADLAEDVLNDVASDKPDAGNCIEQIISSNYTIGSSSCAACKETAGLENSLETECKTMVDCLMTASCLWTEDNCWTACRNAVGPGNQVDTGSCVLGLMTGAGCPTTR